MRAFIAIDLPLNVKDVLYDIQREIGSDLAKIKWISKKNLHLTLKFFADISEIDAEKVSSVLKKIKFKSFKVKLDKLGFFPDARNIKIIWVGLKPVSDVMNLQGDIDESLSEHVPREDKFKAHLTLGRVKFVKKKKEFFERLDKLVIPLVEFPVNKIGFYESKLTKDGPIYYKLA